LDALPHHRSQVIPKHLSQSRILRVLQRPCRLQLLHTMSASRPPGDNAEPANRLPNLAPAPPLATSTLQQTGNSSSPMSSNWTSQSPAPTQSNGPSKGFSEFSATTAEILNRIRSGHSGHAAGTPAFEAKRAEVLQSYVTSDKLPTPPPIANSGRRGRGGRVGTPSQLKTDISASPAPGGTPTSARGSGRGRGRGRGRGGRGGGKRKRSESESSDVSCHVAWRH
jgi:hypothetical protein